jgi:RNA polymerase sigma-70 factor (ECF subfamily)
VRDFVSRLDPKDHLPKMLAVAEAQPASPGPSVAALVVSARAGEMWAKEALFRRHARMVSGMAFRLMGRDEDVDDLVQETFSQALSSLHKLEAPAAFPSWLGGIVVRLAHSTLRKRRLLSRLGLRDAHTIDLDTIVSQDAPADVVAQLRAIYGKIDELPPKLRVPLLLRRVEGLRLEEIATMTETSLATVKRRIREAEQMLGVEEET